MMNNTYCKFKDIKFFNGWIVIVMKPYFEIYYSSDGAPPDNLNTGFWIFGKRNNWKNP